MESLGQFLKREREFKNLSLEDLSKKTKITTRLLQSIEEDRLETLPQGAFVRGFLKSYARAVGLNVEEVLVRYQSLPPSERGEEVDPFRKFRRFEMKDQLFYVILFLVGVIVLATYLSAR